MLFLSVFTQGAQGSRDVRESSIDDGCCFFPAFRFFSNNNQLIRTQWLTGNNECGFRIPKMEYLSRQFQRLRGFLAQTAQ